MVNSIVANIAQQQRRYLIAAVCALVTLIIAWFIRQRRSLHEKPRRSLRSNDGAAKPRRSTSGKSSSRRGKGATLGMPVVDESLPDFILLLGIPGSGKSTWAKNYVFKCDASFTIISSDDVRKQLTGDINDQTKNTEVWEIVMNQVSGGLKNSRNIILDATNVRTDLRRALIRQLPECNRFVKVFPIDKTSAKQRIAKDIANGVSRSDVPDVIVEKMHASFVESQSQLHEEGWIPR